MAEKSVMADKRIPLKPDTFDRIREFCRGLGVSYDDAVTKLLDQVIQPGEDALLAGKRMRDELPKLHEKAG